MRTLRFNAQLWILVVAVPAVFPISAHSASFDAKQITYTIQPIIGYETQRKPNPDRTKVVFIYGVRVIAGYKILSAEGEYTHGTSDEALLSPPQNIKEVTDRYRLGVRSTYDIGTILSATLRGGAETMKRKVTTTVAGSTTTSDAASKVDPYGGLGLSIHLFQALSLVGEVVVTFRDFHDMKKNDVATTVGLEIHFNTK